MARNDIKVVKTKSGNSPEMVYVPLKASETFKQGELVRLTTGDTLAVAAAASTTGLLGVAAEDATTTPTGSTSKATGTLIGVWVANADTIFSAPILTGTYVAGEQNITTDGIIAGGVHGVNPDLATQKNFVILGVDPLATTTRLLVVGFTPDAPATGTQALGGAGSAGRAA